ncbi:MAG: sensor histidine kinase [Caryophanon sp.]|nr:sensor histidine kinase [Caryophanon sp.]
MTPLKISSSKPSIFLWMLFVAMTTAILSQIYLTPFQNGHLRFGLGPVVFLLLLLIHRVPAIQTALLTTIAIFFSRFLLSFWFMDDTFSEAFLSHIPSAMYYLTFGIAIHFVKVEKLEQHTLLLSIISAAIDVCSNLIEHTLSLLLLNDSPLQLSQLFILVIVALFRAFTAVGIYSATVITMQRQQIEEMLKMDSNLYVESLYIQKAMNEIEQITSDSYELYRHLQQTSNRAQSMQALLLAQQIHEVKKDTERIFAGISKMMLTKEQQHYTLQNMLHFITTANSQYAALLNKSVTIEATSTENFTVLRITPLLAILNNLLSNAIEAIEDEGHVTLHVAVHDDTIQFTVTDNGPGIDPDLIPVIFEAGYTTKFNTQGVAATGIGLSHVQQILQRLDGKITVESANKHTQFVVTIPTIYIKKEG